jgi:hypothetical protein
MSSSRPEPAEAPAGGTVYQAYVRGLVDEAPPLSEEQRARLAALLRPQTPVRLLPKGVAGR